MRRLLAFLGLLGCLSLAACGTPALGADPTPVPLPTPTPTINVGPTKTRAAELAILATAQAPTPTSAPVVVVIATPTPDRRPATYLSDLQPLVSEMEGYLSLVAMACLDRGNACEIAVNTNSPKMITNIGKIDKLSFPKSCSQLQDRALKYASDAHGFVIESGLYSATTTTQIDYIRKTKSSLDSLTLSKKIYQAERKSGSCQTE